MFTISPQLSKIILAALFLLPAFSLYIKILTPYLAQTGFDGAVVVCCEIIFIVFIAVFGRHPKNISSNGYYFIAAIFSWHVLGVTSALLSDHFYASLIKQIEYAVHCLFAYSAWVFLSQTKKTEKMSYVLIFTLVWVAYYILAAWHSHPDAYHHDWALGTPMFNNIRHLGYLQIGILPLLFLPLLSNNQYKYVVTLAVLTVFWTSVIWSCSRGTFISAIIISTLLAAFFSTQRKSIIVLSTASFLLGWLIALQFPSESPSLNPLRLLFLNFNDVQLQKIDMGHLSSGRTEIWRLTLSSMWQHNALFGFAADGYRYVTPQIWPGIVQPHNSPIQFFSEFGALGFTALLGLTFFCLKSWYSNPGTLINKLARFGLLAMATGSLIDGHFYQTFSLLLISVLTALAFAAPGNNSQPQSNKAATFILLALISSFIWPIQQHWQTYIVQQFSLTDRSQLEQVKKFPSYYFPMSWLYSSSYVQDLRSESIKFGQENGPKKCNYFLIEYLDSQDKTRKTRLLTSIKETCTKSELNRTQDNILMALALEVKR